MRPHSPQSRAGGAVASSIGSRGIVIVIGFGAIVIVSIPIGSIAIAFALSATAVRAVLGTAQRRAVPCIPAHHAQKFASSRATVRCAAPPHALILSLVSLTSEGRNCILLDEAAIKLAMDICSRSFEHISFDRQNWLRAGWFEYRDTIRVDGKSGKCSFIVVQKTNMYAKNVETWYREAVFKFASIISSFSHNSD
jgi:hypothetical protein